MMLSFQPVTLDSNSPDNQATLVFRDGRLLALLTVLSDIHEDLEGQFYLEAMFADIPIVRPPAFETKEQFAEWLSGAG